MVIPTLVLVQSTLLGSVALVTLALDVRFCLSLTICQKILLGLYNYFGWNQLSCLNRDGHPMNFRLVSEAEACEPLLCL